jgi:hypothetical protein
MKQLRIAFFASSSLAVLALATPASAQDCSERLAELEAGMTKLEPTSEQRHNLQELVEAARVLEWLERNEGCLTMVSEAEAMLRPAEARAERDVRRQEEAVIEEQRDILDADPGTEPQGGPSAADKGKPARPTAGASGERPDRTASSQPSDEPGVQNRAADGEARQVGAETRPKMSKQLSALPPGQLIGKDVHDQRGEAVAQVTDLVRQTSDGTLFAVVEVGGLLGLGTKEVAVPLSEFELGEEASLRLPDRGGSALEDLPPYNETRYVKVTE